MIDNGSIEVSIVSAIISLLLYRLYLKIKSFLDSDKQCSIKSPCGSLYSCSCDTSTIGSAIQDMSCAYTCPCCIVLFKEREKSSALIDSITLTGINNVDDHVHIM